ncbi:hypothetical protein GW17_00004401 [Ensete ventricosum]|nr:hypothetical protein GW17_00004401 [Ensete ventricosum]
MAPASSNCSSSSLSGRRCQALIAVEQGEGSRRSTGGFAPRSVGTLLSCASSPHGRITQALDLLVPRWLSTFLCCYSCCFCGSLVWSTAQPTRLTIPGFLSVSIFTLLVLFYFIFAVSALNELYSNLNSPSQLTGWSSSGGDPCGKDWKGIKCSGSSVTEM